MTVRPEGQFYGTATHSHASMTLARSSTEPLRLRNVTGFPISNQISLFRELLTTKSEPRAVSFQVKFDTVTRQY